MRYRRDGLGFFLFLIFFVLFSPDLFAEQDARVYTVAAEYDYPPFATVSGGLPEGFSIELLSAVAQAAGLNVEYKIGFWDELIEDLKHGNVDILPIVARTPARDEWLDFALPYIIMQGNVFVRKGDSSILSQADLTGKHVLVQQDDVLHEYAVQRGLTEYLVPVHTLTEAFRLLSAGQYDAVLTTSLVGQRVLATERITNVHPVMVYDDHGVSLQKLELEDFEQQFSFAVRNGDEYLVARLNEGMAAVYADGTFQTLYRKWFPFLLNERIPLTRILMSAALLLAPCLVVLVFLYLIMLRHQVRSRTAELAHSNKMLVRQNTELEKARAEALAAANTKTRFLSNMSHEIRNPLNGIIGLSNLLDKTSLTGEQRRYLELIRTSNSLLLGIVNNILDLTKIESGHFMSRKTVQPVRPMFDRLIALVQPLAVSKCLSLTFNGSASVPAEICIDERSFSQIVLNLLNNAVKFTETGSVVLSADVSGTDTLRVEIRDSGIGIPQDRLDDIFESFTQLDSTYDKRYQGSGLGLTIVRELCKRLTIALGVQSEPGRGTVFTLDIPLESSCMSPGERYTAANPVALPGSFSPRTVLVVEDNVINTMIVRKLLEEHGCRVDTALDGLEALERIDATSYDLVLMDIQMPNMNGVDCTREIRRRGISWPVIALTGYSLPETLQEFLDAGMNDCLIKPVEEEKLVAILDNPLYFSSSNRDI